MYPEAFDLSKPWTLDDLPTDLRLKIEEEYDLDPDAHYAAVEGEVIEEVPQCPYCRQGTWEQHRCDHVVFEFFQVEMGDEGYLYIDPGFDKFISEDCLKTHLKDEVTMTDEVRDVLDVLREGRFPHPSQLVDILNGLQYRDVWFYWGGDHARGVGRGYGYASTDLREKISRMVGKEQ